MSTFSHHSKCPRCAEQGKDNAANNLANYFDGSYYCFSCGYYQTSQNYTRTRPTQPKTKPTLAFPFDCEDTSNCPEHVQEYLDKYNLTSDICKKYFISWSHSYGRLCFPLFDDNGLIGWQGRSFTPGKSKWYSQGDLKSIIHVLGQKDIHTLLLVEDIISCIVLAELPSISALTLFGSHLALNKLQKLQLLGYHKFILWLDKDKEKESLKYSYNARQLGYDCISLVTNKDPKDYDKETLKKYLTERTMCATLN